LRRRGWGGDGGNTPSTVAGSAAKGIIANAVVEAYEVLADGTLSAKPVSDPAKTLPDGSYTLTLNSSYQKGALRVIIKGGSGATMTCDIPTGCGNGIVFGQPTPLSDTFRLAAVTPAPGSTTVSVHINALTDLADKIAAKDGYNKASSITGANDRIRQAFSLGADITSIKSIDITKASSIGSGDLNSRQLALVSAALLSAVAKGDEANFEKRLSDFATQVGTDGGLVKNDDDKGAIVSVQDILQAAADVATKANDPNLDAASAQTEYAAADAEKTPASDKAEVITPTEPTAKSGVDKAKSMTADLRMLATAAQSNGELANGVNTFNSYVQGAFGPEAGMTEVIANRNLLLLVDHGQDIATAIAKAADAYTRATENNGTPPTTYTYEYSKDGSRDNIVVNITGDNRNSATFSVKKTFADKTVADISGTATATNLKETGGDTSSHKLTGDASLSLTGTITNSSLKLSLLNTTISITGLDFSATDSEGEDSVYHYEESIKFNSLKSSMGVKIEQVNIDKPVAFSGTLSFELNKHDYQFTNEERYCCNRGDQYDKSSTTAYAESAKLGLSGKFSRDTESLEATLDLAAIVPAGLKFTSMESFNFQNGYASSSSSTESADSYVGATASLVFKGTLQGVGETLVSLSAKRTGLEDGTAEVQVKYKTKAITVKADSKTRAISLTNQDGIVISTIAPAKDQKWDGVIKAGDVKVGDIDTSRDNVIIFRYIDGSFESIL